MVVVSILTIILSVFGINLVFFVYLLNRMGSNQKDLSKEIQKNREEIMWIKFRLDPHEHPYKKNEELKEN